MVEIPHWLTSMIRREPPLEGIVVAGSTPVVSFGDFRSVQVATLGFNPSNQEFESEGKLLTGAQRRLATLESLKANSLSTLTDSQIHQVIDDCNEYFRGNDYVWFKHLDKIIRSGLDVSYFDGTACHLDLVQWSTSKKWSELGKPIQSVLQDDGSDHLRHQLENSSIKLVIVNGAGVWNGLRSMGFGKKTDLDTLTFGSRATRCTLSKLNFGDITFLGWSSNLQSQPGANSDALAADLSKWLRRSAIS